VNYLKHILFVLLITAIGVSAVYAQSTLTMQNVSVINEQGHVRLSWEYDGTEDLVIFRDSLAISSLSPIDTIYDPSITNYTDESAHANLTPRLYKIQSATTPNDIYTPIISTYQLTYDYDSCEAVINIHWTELQHNDLPDNQWNPSGFIIYQYENGILQETNINNSHSSYSIVNIKENTNYTFKIGVEWAETDSIGFSNPVSKFTEMPQSPDYINAIYTRANGNNTDLKFEVAPNSELTTYKLLYSTSPTGSYDTLKTITTTDLEVITTHENSNPNAEITYYKLVAINNCGNMSTPSDIINNILLTLEREENTHSLGWNYFKEYDLPDAHYELYRSKDNAEAQLIRSFSNHNTFDDEIETSAQEIVHGLFCYYIQAAETGSSEYSRSNTVCVYLEPDIFIPEAITPNGDGKNDELKIQPDLSLLPGKYQLIIYDRWLNIIFQTSNPGEAWNGRYSSGKKVPTGVYIYYLKIKIPDNQLIEKRGNITVFYP